MLIHLSLLLMFGELHFVEEVRINGDLEDDLYVFRQVHADPNGKIYVVSDNYILVFAADGNYLSRFGGKGEGPGEFQDLLNFYILADGTGISHSFKGGPFQLQFFDADMNFVRQELLNDRAPHHYYPSPNGLLAYIEWTKFEPNTELLSVYRGVVSRDRKMVQEFKKLDFRHLGPATLENNSKKPLILADWLRNYLEPYLVFGFGPKNAVYSLMSDDTTVTQWDADMGKPVRTFELPEENRPWSRAYIKTVAETMVDEFALMINQTFANSYTDKMVEEAVDMAMEQTRGKHQFFGMMVPVDDRLMMIRDYTFGSGEAIGELYNTQGNLLGKGPLPAIPLLNQANQPRLQVINNRYYSLVVNDDDVTEIIRYRLEIKP